LDILRWDDEENMGDGFIEWKEAWHPVYGKVEIGGFHPKFFSQNAPAKHLLPWAKNEALFNLEMVKALPRLDWEDIAIKKQKSYKNDSVDYEVRVKYRNSGKLPTALKQADLVKIVREDQVSISFGRSLVSGDSPAVKILTQASSRRGGRYGSDAGRTAPSSVTLNAGFTQGGEATEVIFKIRVYGSESVKGSATVSSTRGGILKEKEFIVN
jgi:hypothetical protein